MKTNNQKERNLKAVECALQFLDANDRDTWVMCGMAIKFEFGDEGFDIWDRWGMKSPKYSTENTKEQWNSFKRNKPKKSIGMPTIFYHAMKNGFINDGSYKSIDLTTEERIARDNEIKDLQEKEIELHAAAAKKAKDLWGAAEPINLKSHRYVISKNIEPYCAKHYQGALTIGEMKCNGALMLPMVKNGVIVSLQFISSDGEKRFLPHGEKGSMVIDAFDKISSDAPICICEGYATGASIHEATTYPVVVAFDAGGLVRTAKEIRAKYPNRKIILCADNDESGAGLKFATSAAAATAGFIALPESTTHVRLYPPKDFNDLAKDDGFEEVKMSIDSAKFVEKSGNEETDTHSEESESSSSQDSAGHVLRIKLTRASDIKPEAINWIWNGWLAGGKFHILGGQAGTGKTTIAINLAAIISTGGKFPDGKIAHQGNVLIWSGEDGISDTLVPRLMAAGADLRYVHFIEGCEFANEIRTFDPSTDMEILEDAAEEIGNVSLMIVDPVVSAITGDSHKNSEVRRGLQPLVDLGERLGCAILGITHFTKGTRGGDPLERITGSLAFGAVARVVMAAGKRIEKDEDGDEIDAQWFFCRAKSNLGKDYGGFQYELIQNETDVDGISASSVSWIGEVEGNARDLLSDYSKKRDGNGKTSELDTAIKFLVRTLAEKPVPANTVELAAKDAGFSEATIRRAKERLNIKSRKVGMDGSWCWMLPKIQDAHHGKVDAQHI